MITEIREEDFRKLRIKVKRYNRYRRDYGVISINKVLDEQIKMLLDSGFPEDFRDLQTPVTIAICKSGRSYMDMKTYQMCWGIKHLYSTRDYYETKTDDHWRVRKDETDIVYRVHLKDRSDKFVLKHKTEIINETNNPRKWIEVYYTLDEKTNTFVEESRVKVTKNEFGATTYTPIKNKRI